MFNPTRHAHQSPIQHIVAPVQANQQAEMSSEELMPVEVPAQEVSFCVRVYLPQLSDNFQDPRHGCDDGWCGRRGGRRRGGNVGPFVQTLMLPRCYDALDGSLVTSCGRDRATIAEFDTPLSLRHYR